MARRFRIQKLLAKVKDNESRFVIRALCRHGALIHEKRSPGQAAGDSAEKSAKRLGSDCAERGAGQVIGS